MEEDDIERRLLEKVPQWNFIKKYCIAFAAASIAETVTYPLDLTKIRMQIAGELQKSGSTGSEKRLGMLRTATGIIQGEGILRLWQGLPPAIYRHMIYSGLRMMLYEHLRDDIFGKNPDGSFPVHKAAMAGLVAGGIAQFTASPMDLVKVQLQMEGKRRLEGKPVRVRSAAHALVTIYKEGGIRRGLWKGWVPNVQRGALVNLGDLTTYDTAKRFILNNTKMEDNYLVHIMSSLMSGFIATYVSTRLDKESFPFQVETEMLVSTPADVVKSRIMNQPTKDGVGLYYKGSIDCLRKTIKNETFSGLYKGFIPIWMRMGVWSLTFWVTFEWIRTGVGVNSF